MSITSEKVKSQRSLFSAKLNDVSVPSNNMKYQGVLFVYCVEFNEES